MKLDTGNLPISGIVADQDIPEIDTWEEDKPIKSSETGCFGWDQED